MIFRKFSEPQSATKTPMAATRTEPSLTARAPSVAPALQVTPPVAPASVNAAPRRSAAPGAAPAAAYPQQRNEQMRKLTVGRDITLNGEIATCDHLIVEGTVQATIKGGKMLDIAECGSFSGTVEIDQADIAGHFDGELTVKGKLIIRSSARVTGTLHYAQLQVDTGARVNGTMHHLAQNPSKSARLEEHTQFETTLPQAQQAHGFGLGSLNDAPGFLKASA